ncbi:MAG TPA: energy-coupling factor ABC transporter permease, partial [Coleofasciculaceae cyanobacterium]
IGTAVAAWASVFIASLLCAVQLALSGTISLGIAISAMAFWHVLIGIGEAAITLVAASFIWRTRPDLLFDPPRKAHSSAPRPLIRR